MSTARQERPSPSRPALEAGQRLSRAEFHDRYEAAPPGTWAELLGGVVFMPSPLSRDHDKESTTILSWMSTYRRHTPGVEVLNGTSTFLDDQSETQPDAQIRILPEYGGQTRPHPKYVSGAPELIAEIARSSKFIDLGPKRIDYERAGVREYLVWALDPDEVVWHILRDGRLVAVPTDPDGLYRSETFPGLWLDPVALMADDLDGLLGVLDHGLATPEHAAFVARLAESRGSN